MAKSKTSYSPGSSGNKGGRPKGIGEIRAIARAYSYEAIEILVSIARDKDAREACRIAAASILLDRAWGRAESAKSIDDTTEHMPVEKLNTADLYALLDDLNKGSKNVDCRLEEPE
jgi:hypothetical protein